MEVIELGGRRFHVVERNTLEHLIWMDQQVAQAGVAKILSEGAGIAADRASEFAMRVWTEVSRSGKVMPILSGLLLPEEIDDLDWSPEWAENVAKHLKRLHAPQDIARVRSLLAGVLIGFFAAAPLSSAPSPSASPESGRSVALQ